MPVRPNIYVADSPGKGRGVFAAHPLRKGEVIEICPVIVLPQEERELLLKSKLYDYYFEWGEDQILIAIALGYGSLYNHNYQPNAYYEADYERNTLTFICHNNIDADEEITVNYNCDADDDTPVWFDK